MVAATNNIPYAVMLTQIFSDFCNSIKALHQFRAEVDGHAKRVPDRESECGCYEGWVSLFCPATRPTWLKENRKLDFFFILG